MYHLFVATPDKVYFDDDVISLIAPGTVGSFEILSHHAPFISSLKKGPLTITDKNHRRFTWNITGGFFEMSDNKATLLADSVQE